MAIKEKGGIRRAQGILHYNNANIANIQVDITAVVEGICRGSGRGCGSG